MRKTHPSSKTVAAHSNVTSTRQLLLLLSWFLLLGAAFSYAHAGENLYEKNYKPQSTNLLASMQANPETKIYVSNHKDEDNISMLEQGYDMMGSSGFEAGEISPDLALAHGKKIKADVVLVYAKHAAAKTADGKLEMIREAAKTGKELTEKDVATEPEEYRYYASYWAQLPTPILGVHVIKLIPKASPANENPEPLPGLKLIAVIKDSPAAKAGLVRGDRLTKVNDQAVEKPEELSTVVRKFRGQSVTLHFTRGETASSAVAQLN